MLGFKLSDAKTILFFPTLFFIDMDKEKKLQVNSQVMTFVVNTTFVNRIITETVAVVLSDSPKVFVAKMCCFHCLLWKSFCKKNQF